jgi:hypothetical protein
MYINTGGKLISANLNLPKLQNIVGERVEVHCQPLVSASWHVISFRSVKHDFRFDRNYFSHTRLEVTQIITYVAQMIDFSKYLNCIYLNYLCGLHYLSALKPRNWK